MSITSKRVRSLVALSIACLAVVGPLAGMTFVGLTAPNYIHYLEKISIPLLSFWLVILGGSTTGLAFLPSFFLGAVCGYLLTGGWSYFSSAAGLAWATGIGLYLGRFFSTNFLEVVLQKKVEWWKTYQRVIKTSGSLLPISVALLRLSPHMPFALTNLVCAHLPMRPIKIWFFSYIGLLPRTLFATYFGSKLQDWGSLLDHERPPWELMVSLILLAILFYLIRRTVSRFETA